MSELPPPKETLTEYKDFCQKIQALLKRVYHLNNHIVTGLSVHSDVSKEMDKRFLILEASLKNSQLKAQSSSQSAQELQEGLEQNVQQLNVGLIFELEEIYRHLNEKMDKTANLLALINSVSQQSKTISFRLRVEASRFGKKGDPFLKISDDIKSLADETIASSQEASQRLRLEDFREGITRFKKETSQGLEHCISYVKDATQTLRQIFKEIGSELNTITEHSQVIFEFFHSNTTGHLLEKTGWISQLSQAAQKSIASHRNDSSSPESKQELDDTLKLFHITTGNLDDRLDEILKRGSVRIAIEPDFKGVSFRTKPEQPLQGLDIDYITEFSNWLGVRVEYLESPWDFCPELLDAGSSSGKPVADMMWSALIPVAAPQYRNIAYSESYTCLEYILARRKNDTRIHSLADLESKVLGCIRDPAALDTLEKAGLRWAANESLTGGKVMLSNLVAYSDQSRIHDCLANGRVDAFTVDKPIYYWACHSPESPWHNKIEILPGNLGDKPWIYAVGVAAQKSSFRLLKKTNEFIAWFKQQPRRIEIETKWQGGVVPGLYNYSDKAMGLIGECELLAKQEAF